MLVWCMPLGLRQTIILYGVMYTVCVHSIDPDKMKAASKACYSIDPNKKAASKTHYSSDPDKKYNKNHLGGISILFP